MQKLITGFETKGRGQDSNLCLRLDLANIKIAVHIFFKICYLFLRCSTVELPRHNVEACLMRSTKY